MDCNLTVERFLQFIHTANVVGMPVRQENILNLQPQSAYFFQYYSAVVSGINDDCVIRSLVIRNISIFL